MGTTTGYAGNNGTLQFFSTPEGYMTPDGMGGYDYVYQYKDHLGNVRLSYAEDPSDPGMPTIIEENNYYPFGLKHKGYNTGGGNSLGNGVAEKYKTYQGQEFTDDLGLNVHEWKYRISDPAIGRFWQVDPLAEKYVYNGVYNFSENRVVDAVELEAYLLHGTGNWDADNYFGQELQNNLQNDYGSFQSLAWSGSAFDEDRISEASRVAVEIIADLPNYINSEGKFDNPILIGGHSHGGNIARLASKEVLTYLTDSFQKGDITEMPELQLLMLNTPTMAENNPFPFSGETDYSFNLFQNAMIETIQVDSNMDFVAGIGQFLSDKGSLNIFYSNTKHIINYKDQYDGWSLPDIGNHNGHLSKNVKVWYPMMQESLKAINR